MRSLSSRIVPVATYGGEVSSTLSRKVLRLCGCALTMPCLLPRRELFFAAIPNKTRRCVGERLVVKVTLRSPSLGMAYGDDRVFLRDARLCVERAL